jgi:hypothetical protein
MAAPAASGPLALSACDPVKVCAESSITIELA